MKKKLFKNLIAVVLCAALLIPCLPFSAFAGSAQAALEMVEGDVTEGFVPAGTECTSSDPSVAWVDENGSLNAMKVGTAVISDGTDDYTVTVSDYEDGSEVVGNLKLLVRYNDSMQFYDGHVYLLFTSYQDGVTVTVPDLYAAYEIQDEYYEDINEDISNGSNHTGTDAYNYFSEMYDVDSMTLNRGEIVTIGMYRGFELSVAQAALGTVMNSSLWADVVAAGKTAAVTALFDWMQNGKISSDEALARFKSILTESGLDYTRLFDGFVSGGVCFNRELFNQKLEWDQYENVTYELDITRNQLDALAGALDGNNGSFSILNNSCATVALRAWNAAVGTRGGEPTSYYLTAGSDGIYSFIDAPKGVRDNIVKRLPGYYLNNAEGVAEPDAGYQDETGWVYVSAPEKVSPLTLVYDDDSIVIEESGFKSISDLINAAKGDASIVYNKDAQEISVSVKYEKDGEWTTVNGIDFDVNGTVISLDGSDLPEDGVNLTYPYADPPEGEYYLLLDRNGEEVSGYFSEGNMFIHAESFPITYRVTSAPDEDTPSGVGVFVGGVYDTDITAEVYYISDGERVYLDNDGMNYLDEGTKVFIKSVIPADEDAHVLSEIMLNDDDVMNGDHYDSEENAYFIVVPEEFVWLSVNFEEAALSFKRESLVQIEVGDVLDIKDFVKLTVGWEEKESDNIAWEVVYDPSDGCVECDETTAAGAKAGTVLLMAYAAENHNIFDLIMVEVYESFDDLAVITLDGDADDYDVRYSVPDDDSVYTLDYSGYRIEKGSKVFVVPRYKNGKALWYVTCNGINIEAGETYTVEEDTVIKAATAEATMTGVPRTVRLSDDTDCYKLEAEVRYVGLRQFLPVYDSTITYSSSDPLIEVDEDGLITVAGEVPEEGAIAYVTAYAGSSNNSVSATTKVIVGDCEGERIVGSLTISARPIVKAQLISHAMITYTAYEDTEFNVSYYDYYKPNEKYIALMQDYADHPEKYSSDPALYSDNELGIEDRDSYFDISHAGAYSEPQPVQLAAGNSVTISDYGAENTPLYFILTALENSTLSTFSPQAQELAQNISRYIAGEEFDAPAAFDDLITASAQIYVYSKMLGFNPADGIGEGGIMINREAYNQFRRNDSQTPNHYYTVDITADELAMLKGYLADPQNNYYSLMVNSCASSTVNIWNTTLADRPELRLKGNYTGLAAEPMSVYYEIWFLKYKSDIDGIGGDDFYPRLVSVNGGDEPIDPDKPEPDDPDDPDEPYPVYLNSWYMLGDADGDGEVSILDATAIQRYLVGLLPEDCIDPDAARITEDAVNILDATYIQRYLVGLNAPYPIGIMFNRATGEQQETIEQTVIADKNGVKVTAESFGRQYCPYLTLTVENSSSKDVYISFSPITANGFQIFADFLIQEEEGEMYSPSVTVPAGSSSEQVLYLDDSIMDRDFMSFIAQIGFTTVISDTEDYSFIASDKAVINTSAYGSFDYSYDESGEVVYDGNGIKILFVGISDDGLDQALFYVNNQSGKDLVLQVKESKLNGEEVEGVLGAQIFSGCRSICSPGFLTEVGKGDTVQLVFEIFERAEVYGEEQPLYTTDEFTLTI